MSLDLKRSDWVKRKVPLDILFTPTELATKQNPFYGELTAWEDVPIVNFDPYMQGVGAFFAKGNALEPLLDFERKRRFPDPPDGNRLKRELTWQTSALARVLERPLPRVSRYQRDRLNLADGAAQCCIAKLRGADWISVLMPKDIAEVWDARPTAALDAEISRQQRDGFYTPVLHEKYRKWPVSRRGSGRLDLMRRFLGPVRRQLSLLDIGCNTGYYTFHFHRQGFHAVGIDFDASHLAIAKALCSTYSADVPFLLCRFDAFNPGRSFDIALGLSVFWHMLGWGQFPASITPEALGRKLDDLVQHALFWESGKRRDEEIDIIRTYSGLSHYTKLGETSATGIEHRDFGVFTRHPPEDVQSWLRGA